MKATDRLQALVAPVRDAPPRDPPPPDPPAARLRAAPDRPGVRALVLLAVIAAVVAAGYLWASRPRPDAAPAPDAGVASLAAGPAAPEPSAGPGPSTPPTGTVVVHVLGKVRKPGVITLPADSRVAEAIKAAGGVRRGAETGPLNLARKVVDGEQIPVGVPAPTPPPGAPAPGAPAPGAPSPGGAPVNLNTATVDQLDDLPGVGPVLAARIIEYRTRNGGFRSVDQLQDVNGIGASRFADLEPKVSV
ncbi:ComEA family DNA-binding protein [Actinomadura rifamycini]|uniref:ComEA family DNA-binding protein n=1 Tax=Actinomadura rifamycini TaxID=31962 RepID=UPI00041FB00D|nr:ComEA family DNA-binding protein [Actinomadura rifamycini]